MITRSQEELAMWRAGWRHFPAVVGNRDSEYNWARLVKAWCPVPRIQCFAVDMLRTHFETANDVQRLVGNHWQCGYLSVPPRHQLHGLSVSGDPKLSLLLDVLGDSGCEWEPEVAGPSGDWWYMGFSTYHSMPPGYVQYDDDPRFGAGHDITKYPLTAVGDIAHWARAIHARWPNVGGSEDPHRIAMTFADLADKAKRNGRPDDAKRLYTLAFTHERSAAMALKDRLDLEPTRSVFYRSAATLAMQCGEMLEASQLAALGLAGNPPAEIAKELTEIQEATE